MQPLGSLASTRRDRLALATDIAGLRGEAVPQGGTTVSGELYTRDHRGGDHLRGASRWASRGTDLQESISASPTDTLLLSTSTMSGQINAQAGPSRTSSPSLRPRNPTIRPPSPLVHATPVALPPTSSSSFEPGAPSTTQHSPSKPTAPPLPPFLSRILATHHPPPQPSSPSYGPEAKPTPQSLYLPPPAIPDVEEDLVPPENFALVCKGVYRSGFPKKRNFGFMQTLGLKTIL